MKDLKEKPASTPSRHLFREFYKNKCKAAIDFYNVIVLESNGTQIETIEEMPPKALSFLLHLDYLELRAPFIKESLLSGSSVRQVARVYNVNPNHVFKCRKAIGLYKP